MSTLPPELQLLVARALTAAGGENVARPVGRIWREAANEAPLAPRALYRVVLALGARRANNEPPPTARERLSRSVAEIEAGLWRMDVTYGEIALALLEICRMGGDLAVARALHGCAGDDACHPYYGACLAGALDASRADIALWLLEEVFNPASTCLPTARHSVRQKIIRFCKDAAPHLAARICRAVPRYDRFPILRKIYAAAGGWGAAWTRPFVLEFGFGLCLLRLADRLRVKTQMLASAGAAGDRELAQWLVSADAPGPKIGREGPRRA